MGKEQKKDKYGNYFKAYYHIFQIKELTEAEKMVLLVVHNLDNSEKHCWATNKYIAELLNISVPSVSNSIGRLTDLELISRDGLGKNRVLFSNLPLPQPIKISEVDDQPIKISEVQPIKNPSQPIKIQAEPNKNPSQPIKIYNIIDKDNLTTKKGKDKDIKDLSSDKESDDISTDSVSKNSPSSKDEEKIYSKDSLPYLLSLYLLKLVLQNYPNFDVTRLQDKSYREKKLQNGANSIDLMIRIDKRPSKEIEEVMEWSAQDAFWCQNIKSPQKLRIQYDELLIKMGKVGVRKQEVELLEDPNPEITAKFLKAHQQFATNRYQPTNAERNKLIEATIVFEHKYPNSQKWVQNDVIELLTFALRQEYCDRGKPVKVGCWCSKYTWGLYDQACLNVGVPEAKIYDFPDKEPPKLEKWSEEHKQPKSIESDLPSGF